MRMRGIYVRKILDPVESNVNTTRINWRDDFPGTSLGSGWQIAQTGIGHSISVGSSVLSMATGTTPNTETIIKSTFPIEVPLRVWFICYLTQRIANQEFYLELVNANEDMYAGWKFDGTTNTYGRYYSAHANTSGISNSSTILATNNYNTMEIELFPEEVYFSNRYTDSTSSKPYVFCRSRYVPDPLQEYYVRIRAKNLATAPTSSTTLNIDAVVIQNANELTARIIGGRGGGGASQSVPVYSTGGSTTANTYDRLVWYTDSTTPLAASASYTGTARDGSSTGSYNKFRARSFADQDGTLYIDQSRDGTTWRTTDSVLVGAGETKFLEAKVVARYVRVRYVNGATAQTNFELISAFVGLGA